MLTSSNGYLSGRVCASWVVVSAMLTGCPHDVVVGETVIDPLAEGDAGAGDADVTPVTCARDSLPSPEGDVIVEIASRDGLTCALNRRGRVLCWGVPGIWERPTTPVLVPGLSCVRTLSDGSGSAFVIDDDTARAYYTAEILGAPRPVIGVPRGLSEVAGVASAAGRSCTWHRDGSMRCWGAPFRTGPRDDAVPAVSGRPYVEDPTLVPSLVDVVQASTTTDVGTGFMCVVHRDRTVSCLGANGTGQLGDGTVTPRTEPRRVAGLDDVAQVSVALYTSCAVRNDGRVMCWGGDDHGQLGDAPDRHAWTPVEVRGVVDATQIAVGHSHVCARTARGTVLCWGGNEHGELGDGTTAERRLAAEVPGLRDVVQVAAGAMHTCALSSDGAVRCWGLAYSALPDGRDGALVLSPRRVAL